MISKFISDIQQFHDCLVYRRMKCDETDPGLEHKSGAQSGERE